MVRSGVRLATVSWQDHAGGVADRSAWQNRRVLEGRLMGPDPGAVREKVWYIRRTHLFEDLAGAVHEGRFLTLPADKGRGAG